MKKLFITLLLFCFCVAQGAHGAMIIQQFTSGGGGDCPSGTYLFAYDGDYPSDTDKACFDSGSTQKDGTTNNASTSTAYVEITAGGAANNYITWAVSGGDGIDDEEGVIYFSVYIVDDGDADLEDTALFESYNGASNFINIRAEGTDDRVWAKFSGDGNLQQVISVINTIDIGAWYRVGYRWSSTAHNISSVLLSTCTPSWSAGDTETLTAWNGANQPDDITFGKLAGDNYLTDTPRIADVYILSGYSDSDPLCD